MGNSLNLKPIVKRVAAYLIDLLVIWVVGTLISIIPVLNYRSEEYEEISQNYRKEYDEYSNIILALDEAYKDSEITVEEYNNIGEKLVYPSSEYEEIYLDQEVTKEEYTKFFESINNKYEEIFKDYQYLASKNSYVSSIILLVCQILYFGVFQYLMHGATIGKKIFKLKVVSINDKKISVLTFILRSLIVNDILLNAVNVGLLIFISKETYFIADNILSVIVSIVEALIIFFVISRNDQRGLHDLIFKTQVVLEEDKK